MVLIAHREQMVIDALSAELALQAMEVRTATSASELLSQVGRGSDLDTVILDSRLFATSGLDQIRKLVVRLGKTPLILFAGTLEPRIIALLLKAGVRGIIPETLPLKAIPSVLYLVGLGQVFTGGLSLEPAFDDHSGANALTEEEYGVLRRAAVGDTNKEIAAQFDVTEVRVKMLMRAICRKISARNRAHACIIAREQGLL
ncbi:two-component system nitrate/nitrite response regulator NarP [Rhodobacter maris]|uniref:Two-component system nitrate/nitrite response regulator NarP n=2 Tax=Rhodobacter maris TaxID=446682 RepID=A0A285TKS4_9RHOB|nr:two-component system nitrate/nitrite response regulator NarP [Rhodobacter maris]